METERAVDDDAMLASDVTVVVDEGGEKAVAETDGSRDDVERMEPGQEVVDDEQQLNADDDVIPAGDVDDTAGIRNVHDVACCQMSYHAQFVNYPVHSKGEAYYL